MIWLMGWGTATHSGAGDPDTVLAAKGNRLPLSSEITPNTTGTTSGTLRVNPHFFGIEAMHASEGPTAIQKQNTVLLAAALLWLLGGPRNGYGAPSVPMHRELTTQRSDPQGTVRGGFRPLIATRLAAGPPSTTPPVVVAPPPPPPPAPTLKTVTVKLTVDPPAVPLRHPHTLTATLSTAVPGTVRFEWHRGDGKWTAFGAPVVVAGTVATLVNKPGANADHHYRARFTPQDPKVWAPSTSTAVVAPVIDLVALRRAATGK
jgi:hypothetical protein